MTSSTQPHGGRKYLIAASALRTDIESGEHPVGDKLPTPERLGKRYGVSKVTMEKAVAVLRDEGLLETFVGDGTYVRAKARQTPNGGDADIAAQLLKQSELILKELSKLDQRVSDLEKQRIPRGGSPDRSDDQPEP